MPIYEYRCSRCSREFEKYIASPAAGVACPACESSDVTRRLSLVTFRASGPSATASMGGGGCCGGGCGCH